MNDDNITHIITAETVGLDQLASFDSIGQSGPGVTFEIACNEVKRLTTRNDLLETVLRNWLEFHDWCIAAGGTEGPLPQDVIEKFAEMQIPIIDAVRQLLDSEE